MSILKKISYNFVLVAVLWHVNGNAQEVKMYSDKEPSAKELGDILFPNQPETNGIKMRSIKFAKSKQNSAVGLPIKFKFDSDEILVESKPFLNEIGKMLTLPNFANEKLIIEGHTDATGSEEYNRFLSKKRALSVKKYLRDNFNIVSNRLFVKGMGESQPLTGVAAHAAANRRVQFRKAP